MNQVSWALGCHSIAGSPPFPTVVMDDQVIALQAYQAAAAVQGRFLAGIESTQSVLEHWDHNHAVIDGLVKQVAGGALPALRAQAVPLAGLKAHAPIPAPRQIFCTGANYRSHVLQLAFDQPDSLGAGDTPEERRAISARKMDERAKNGLPYAFLKLPSAVVGPNDPIVLPREVAKPDWELPSSTLPSHLPPPSGSSVYTNQQLAIAKMAIFEFFCSANLLIVCSLFVLV